MIVQLAPRQAIGRHLDNFTHAPWRFALAILGAHLLMLLPILALHGFDPSALIVAGDRFVSARHTPAPIIIRPHSDGYDGQFYYRLALSPWLPRENAFGIDLAHPAWRMQRILLPLLARGLALGNAAAIPWAFLAINAAGIFAIAATASLLARRLCWPWFVPAAIAVWPAWLIALTHDTTEILAAALLLSALAAYLARRFAAYAALIALATLTRETSILVAAGIAACEAASWLRHRDWAGLRRPALAGLALLPFVVWRQTVAAIWHTTPQAHGVAENVGWPLLGWAEAILVNVLNRAVGAAAHPRDLAMRLTMLAGIVTLSLFCLSGVRVAGRAARTPRQAGIAAGWLLTLALMSVLTANGPWIDPTAYLRAFSECWCAGWVLLGLGGAGLPMPRLAGLLLACLVVRNWELCWIQLR
jgi:hypothetical protein